VRSTGYLIALQCFKPARLNPIKHTTDISQTPSSVNEVFNWLDQYTNSPGITQNSTFLT